VAFRMEQQSIELRGCERYPTRLRTAAPRSPSLCCSPPPGCQSCSPTIPTPRGAPRLPVSLRQPGHPDWATRPGRRTRNHQLADAARRAWRWGARLPTGRRHRSAVPDEQSGEVGGLQNTITNLGASIGTALAGAVLISALTASFFTGIQDNPAIPEQVSSNAQVKLASGIRFISDDDLRTALQDAGVPAATADAIGPRHLPHRYLRFHHK
jgi:hypothetical protein